MYRLWPRLWLRRADEARAVSLSSKSHEAKRLLHEIAELYDQLALIAERDRRHRWICRMCATKAGFVIDIDAWPRLSDEDAIARHLREVHGVTAPPTDMNVFSP